jgi:hypothetical protein
VSTGFAVPILFAMRKSADHLGRSVLRSLALSGLVLVCGLLLTSCKAEVTTLVDVQGDSAAGSLIVRMEAEAAAALRDDPGTDQRLMDELSRRSQAPVQRNDKDGAIEYRTTLPASNSLDLSGVRVDSVVRNGDHTTVRLTMQSPAQLAAAYRASVEGQTDGAARAIVMEKSTSICAQVQFVGPITSVNIEGGAPEVRRGDRQVRICSSMEDLVMPVTVQVDGGNSPTLPIIWIASVVLVLLVLGGLYRRSLRRKA